MSLYINTLVADAHRTQLIREAADFRRGREARRSAAVARKAHRRAASASVAAPAAPVASAAPATPVTPATAAGLYCRRAAAYATRTASPVGGAC